MGIEIRIDEEALLRHAVDELVDRLLHDAMETAKVAIEKRVRELVDETFRARANEMVDLAVRGQFEKTFHHTNSYGELLKEHPMTFLELVMERVDKACAFTAKRDDYGRGDSVLKLVVKEQIEHRCKAEFEKAIADGKETIAAELRKRGAEVMGEVLKRAADTLPGLKQ